jgi:hypothetical protein
MKKLSLPKFSLLSSLALTSILGISAAGSQALAAESPLTIYPTTVSNIRVYEAIPSSPNTFHKIVRVKVLLGGNPCSARSAKAIMEATRRDGNLVLTPRTIRALNKEPAICTTEWRPVYTETDFDVTGESRRYNDILIENVETANGPATVGLGSLQ